MRSLVISLGETHPATIVKTAMAEWAQLVALLSKPVETADKATAGWYCPAHFRPAYRDSDNFVARHALTFDYDHIEPADVATILFTYSDIEYFAYTTWSHTPEKPRLRIVIPTDRPMTYDEFQAVSRKVADRFGIEKMARESHVPAQFMYRPAVKPGAPFEHWHNPGPWLVVDAVLKEYANWTDKASWPHRRDKDSVHNSDDLGVPPDQKPGLIGEFCRTFTVPAAIEKFNLPYKPSGTEGRWTYASGSRPEGAIVYDNGLKLHSHHDTDPAGGQNNAFDLVRLHLFGWQDAEEDRDQPVTKRPSFKAMAELVANLPEIRTAHAASDFQDLGPLPPINTNVDNEQSDASPLAAQQKSLSAEVYAELCRRYIFVAEQNRFMDVKTRKTFPVDAIKTVETCLMPKTKGGGRIDPIKKLRELKAMVRCASLGYHPGAGLVYEENGAKIANTYTPYAPPDLEPRPEELATFNWLVDRLFGEEHKARDYALDSLAYILQCPGGRIASVPLLIGQAYGSGKSSLYEVVPRLLFGSGNVRSATKSEVDSDFNDWLANAQVVCLPEIWMAGARNAQDLANRLKDTITSDILRIHPKGMKGYEQTNRVSLFATSNYSNAVHIQEGDRRWGIHITSAQKMTEAEVHRLYNEFLLTERAPGVLRYIFRSRSLAAFSPTTAPPNTSAKEEVIEASYSPAKRELVAAWREEESPFDRDLVMIDDVRNRLQFSGANPRQLSNQMIADILREHPINATRTKDQKRIRGTRARLWIVRRQEMWKDASEGAMRSHFEKAAPLPGVASGAEFPELSK